MASVKLEFALPAVPGIDKIRIYESPTSTGTFNFIDEVEDVGSYPDYISYYTTDNATATNYWFAIKWVDDGGAESDLSAPWQGNTHSVVAEIAQRVVQRGVTASNSVVLQEAEAVVQRFFGVDPYSIDVADVTYLQYVGFTYLVMARLIMIDITSGSSDSYTAGLVSQKSQSGTTDKMKFLDDLIGMASDYLGIPRIAVMQLADIDPVGLGSISSVNFDQSRLAVTINLE